MDVSLFKRLAQAHPHSIVTLSAQYRMNRDVMTICNSLIYENRLHCANEKVAAARIVLPDVCSLPMLRNIADPNLFWPSLPSPENDWLLFALNPDNSVVFINTDRLYERLFHESPIPAAVLSGGNLVNLDEVEIIRQLLFGLDVCGFDLKEIGIISPYRAQVNAIRSCLAEGLSKTAETEAHATQAIDTGYADAYGIIDTPVKEVSVFDVNTVDKFQGRDMEVVIISTVKSLNDGPNVSILTDVSDCVHMYLMCRDYRSVICFAIGEGLTSQ
jgi:DNA replication ATP-dependent helicase Dna2